SRTTPTFKTNPFAPTSDAGFPVNVRPEQLSVTREHMEHFEQTRARNNRPAEDLKTRGPALPFLDSDILRPAHLMVPYPSYRESQIERGLFGGGGRRLP
ncbi:MAG TPA: hypothetical protein VGH65_07180, partial [Verrucomicrobiaceae bacterium]